jgi:hypothetical protein
MPTERRARSIIVHNLAVFLHSLPSLVSSRSDEASDLSMKTGKRFAATLSGLIVSFNHHDKVSDSRNRLGDAEDERYLLPSHQLIG